MNEPIINPWIFYFMEIADTVITFSTVSLIISIMAVVAFISYHFEKGLDFAEYKKRVIKMTILPVFFALIIFFVPSSETIARMTIARQITPANIETAKETGKDFIDYIVEKVKDTQGEET